MTLSQLSGEGTRGKLGTDGVQSVTSCWGETNSRFLPLGRIGFAPEYWRHFGLERCGMRAPRLTSEGSTGLGRLSAPTMEYTGEPLWLTGTVSKIC
jgi:hypothetical protein